MRDREWSKAKRSLSNTHEREGSRGHGLGKRDSVASTERRGEGKRFMDNACSDA